MGAVNHETALPSNKRIEGSQASYSIHSTQGPLHKDEGLPQRLKMKSSGNVLNTQSNLVVGDSTEEEFAAWLSAFPTSIPGNFYSRYC